MSQILQFSDLSLSVEQILPLLLSSQLMPQLICELVIQQAIAPTHLMADEVDQSDDDFRQIRISQFKEERWGNKLLSYFLQRKQSLDRVIYSIIRTTCQEVADELFFRIQAHEQSFAELASLYSDGMEAKTSGIVGPVAIGSLPPSLAQLLVTSQPGQLRRLQFDQWFAIIRLEHLLPAQFDDSMRQSLLNELFEQWLTAEVAQRLAT